MGGKLVVRKTAWYMGGYAISRIKAKNKAIHNLMEKAK